MKFNAGKLKTMLLTGSYCNTVANYWQIDTSFLITNLNSEMLCPEVWNFDPPSFSVSTRLCETEEEIFRSIRQQYFNHYVSVTLPNTIQIPNDLINALTEDSQYYRINGIPATELIKKDFLHFFVNKGHLTAISLKECSDQNFLIITPCRKLILSLSKSTFQELGVESTFAKRPKNSLNKYILVLDLTTDINSIKKYDKLQKKFTGCNNLCFDVILTWEPESSDVCPSSIAYYFSQKDYFVKTCEIIYKHRVKYNVTVPLYDDDIDVSDLIEWIGAFNLDCDLSNDDYISSMKCPEKNEIFGQVMHLSFTGLIPHSRLKKIISAINEYITTNSPLMWISLTVQSFQDSILSLRNKHLFVSDGDQNCTIIFQRNHSSIIYHFQDNKG